MTDIVITRCPHGVDLTERPCFMCRERTSRQLEAYKTLLMELHEEALDTPGAFADSVVKRIAKVMG